MNSDYDENIRENQFFLELSRHHSDIIKRAINESWIICVPRSGTLESDEITVALILDQVLIPHNDNNLLRNYQKCSTLSKKPIRIRKNQIITDDCQIFPNTINILFKETFYEDKEKYTIWCIDKPLFVGCSHVNPRTQVLESLPDCIDFLWVESKGQELLGQIQHLCNRFAETNPNYQLEHIQSQKDLIGNLYSRCLQRALKNGQIHDRTQNNEQYLEKLKLAVETYMQYCLDRLIVMGIATFLLEEDVTLNRILSTFRGDQSDVLVAATKELNKLNNSNTILDKVNCLDTTFNVLCGLETGKTLTTDDVILLFVSLILNADIYNWISNLNFIRDFKFCTSSFTEHVDYLLTTIEAALEYVRSEKRIRKPSRRTEIFEVFEYVGANDLSALKRVFEGPSVGKDNLCHPLCVCDDCLEISKSVLFDKFIRNEKNQNLLIYAALRDNLEVLAYFLEQDLEVNCQDDEGRSALHYACLNGNQDAVLLLVSHRGVDVNLGDRRGDTALHVAAGRGHDNCVKALIYSSDDLDTNVENNRKEKAIVGAVKAGFFTIVKIILENVKMKPSYTEIRKLMVVSHDFFIESYLKTLAVDNTLQKFESIRVGTSKFSSAKENKRTVLLIKAIKNNDLPLTCFYLGFDHTKCGDDRLPTTDCHPLCDCTNCRNAKEQEVALSGKALNEHYNVNACGGDGYAALHAAAQYGRTKIMRVLLDCGARVNLRTEAQRYTPLHLACSFKQIGAVKELLQCNECDVNARDVGGRTPLFHACLNNDSRIIEVLLKNDADCYLKDNRGMTVWDVCQRKFLYCAFKTLKDNTTRCSNLENTESLGL